MVPWTGYGIIPHWSSLSAIGAATMVRNALRISASFLSISIARCSITAFSPVAGWLFSVASCTQLEVWHFWMIFGGDFFHHRVLGYGRRLLGGWLGRLLGQGEPDDHEHERQREYGGPLCHGSFSFLRRQ